MNTQSKIVQALNHSLRRNTHVDKTNHHLQKSIKNDNAKIDNPTKITFNLYDMECLL